MQKRKKRKKKLDGIITTAADSLLSPPRRRLSLVLASFLQFEDAIETLIIAAALSKERKKASYLAKSVPKRLTEIFEEETITMKNQLSTLSINQEAHGQPVVAVEFSPDPATSNLFATVGKNQVIIGRMSSLL